MKEQTKEINPYNNNDMKITRNQLINYLVDVLGYGEEESQKIASIYGTSYLTSDQLQECVNFNI